MQGFKHAHTFGLNFTEFVSIATYAIKKEPSQLTVRDQHIRHEVDKGFYADRLEQFLDVFLPRDILILFHDHLAVDTAGVTKRAAQFAGLNTNFFDSFDFSVENRSRAHRNASLRTWGSLVNRRLEPLLNRAPALRRSARALYDAVNTTEVERLNPNPDSLADLRQVYAGPNRRLASLLKTEFGLDDIPAWLNLPDHVS
jgi:hypothetical protein